MSKSEPLKIEVEVSKLPTDRSERHEAFVDCFGQFLFWIRNRSLEASRTLIESEEARNRLGSIRRKYYDGIAEMTAEQREAAMLFLEESLNGFGERLVWFLGGSGSDLKLESKHAYRFQVLMEIIDISTNEVVEKEIISVGGKKFFGTYWGRWLNRHKDK